MGSKTRRLRVAAGAAGLSYQADVRRAARAAAQAAEPAVAPTQQAPAASRRLYPARIESVSIDGKRFEVVDSDVVLALAPPPPRAPQPVGMRLALDNQELIEADIGHEEQVLAERRRGGGV